MFKRCPECRGMLVRNNYEILCRRCGLVINDEPVCIGKVLVFK